MKRQEYLASFLIMAYKFELPPETIKDLWRLREFCGETSIIGQIRVAVQRWIRDKETEIGCSISDVQEARERHETELLNHETNKSQSY